MKSLAFSCVVVLFATNADAVCDVRAATDDKPCQLREDLGLKLLEEIEFRLPTLSDAGVQKAVELERKITQDAKKYFGEMCTLWTKYDQRVENLERRSNVPVQGLLSTELFRQIGTPDMDERQDAAGIQGRTWEWRQATTTEGVVQAIVLFVRATSSQPWRYGGCSWCDKHGCVSLPFDPR